MTLLNDSTPLPMGTDRTGLSSAHENLWRLLPRTERLPILVGRNPRLVDPLEDLHQARHAIHGYRFRPPIPEFTIAHDIELFPDENGGARRILTVVVQTQIPGGRLALERASARIPSIRAAAIDLALWIHPDGGQHIRLLDE